MNTENSQSGSAIAANLSSPFPEEMEKTIVKGGASLIYLPISEVINRLNKVIGVDSWSFEIVSVARDVVDADEVIAHINLSVLFPDGKLVTKHGIGGQSVKRAKSSGKPIDLGNDFKGAVSDALKKAAQTLGIGLYLARSADAMDVEMMMDAEIVSNNAPVKVIDEEVSLKWDSFVGIAKALSAEKREELNSYWDKESKGGPKPRKETVTVDELNGLIAEATRLSFGGEFVSDAK